MALFPSASKPLLTTSMDDVILVNELFADFALLAIDFILELTVFKANDMTTVPALATVIPAPNTTSPAAVTRRPAPKIMHPAPAIVAPTANTSIPAPSAAIETAP